jgi:hypothetical protein
VRWSGNGNNLVGWEWWAWGRVETGINLMGMGWGRGQNILPCYPVLTILYVVKWSGSDFCR